MKKRGCQNGLIQAISISPNLQGKITFMRQLSKLERK